MVKKDDSEVELKQDAADKSVTRLSADGIDTLGASKQSMRWYVVNVFSGFEDKGYFSHSREGREKGLSHAFGEIVAPKQELTEVKRGVKECAKGVFSWLRPYTNVDG